MRHALLLIIGFFLNLPGCLTSEVITQSVVNIYIHPEKDTEVDSQAIYGSRVEVIENSDNGWSKIRTADGIEGWVESFQIINNLSFESSDQLRPVKNLFAHIYRVTDTSPFPPLLTVPYGTKIKLSNVFDTAERWIEIELVSGDRAWIQRGDIDFNPQTKTMDEMIAFSKKFLGFPYTWGGASSFGFDCSGFVQMLFNEMGYLLPRNSRDQAQYGLFIPVAREDLQPGDLVFFGNTKITHVGLYLGNEEYIHSGVTDNPIIKISNFQTGNYKFQPARRIDPLKKNAHRISMR